MMQCLGRQLLDFVSNIPFSDVVLPLNKEQLTMMVRIENVNPVFLSLPQCPRFTFVQYRWDNWGSVDLQLLSKLDVITFPQTLLRSQNMAAAVDIQVSPFWSILQHCLLHSSNS